MHNGFYLVIDTVIDTGLFKDSLKVKRPDKVTVQRRRQQ